MSISGLLPVGIHLSSREEVRDLSLGNDALVLDHLHKRAIMNTVDTQLHALGYYVAIDVVRLRPPRCAGILEHGANVIPRFCRDSPDELLKDWLGEAGL